MAACIACAEPAADTSAADTPAAADTPPPRHLTSTPDAARPLFALPDLAGSPLKLEDHAGRVVLVHFFATWCEPCRAEMASLSRLADGPLRARIAVIAVNVAEVPDRVRRFLQAAPVRFPVVLDADRAVTRAWGVGILPTTFVLTPGLRVRLRVEGDLDWSRADVASALEALDRQPGEGAQSNHRELAEEESR